VWLVNVRLVSGHLPGTAALPGAGERDDPVGWHRDRRATADWNSIRPVPES
jgi:hypothetical protein